MQKCRELMTNDLRWVPSTAKALEAARIMRENAIGFLPVCEPSTGQLVGVVTDRDLVTRMVAANGLPSETDVTYVATSGPVSCRADADVSVAETAMRNFQISRVVVTDDLARPVGVLSLTDILMNRRDRRALATARAVLQREAASPQPAPEDVTLTPAQPEGRASFDPYDEWYTSADELPVSTTAVNREAVIIGGRETRTMKEFPR